MIVRLAVLFVLAAGCMREVGYVDLSRAFNESAEGKRAADEMRAMEATRKKAKADELEAMKLGPIAKPIASDAEWGELVKRRAEELVRPGEARLRRILPAIAKGHHLAAILPVDGAFYLDPALDVTAELRRRFDAGDGADEKTAQLAAAKAQVADLERQLAKGR